jgi:hypothetical protein
MNKPAYCQKRLTVLRLARDAVPRRSKPFPFHLDHIVSAVPSNVMWKAQPAPRASLSPRPYTWRVYHLLQSTRIKRSLRRSSRPSHAGLIIPSTSTLLNPPAAERSRVTDLESNLRTTSSPLVRIPTHLQARPTPLLLNTKNKPPLIRLETGLPSAGYGPTEQRLPTLHRESSAFRTRRREIVNRQPMPSLGGRDLSGD